MHVKLIVAVTCRRLGDQCLVINGLTHVETHS
jgi:hypothetical protein